MNHGNMSRAVGFALTLVLGFGGLSMAACAPQQGSGSDGGRETAGRESDGLEPLTEDIYYQGTAEPANEPHTEEFVSDIEGDVGLSDEAVAMDAETLLACCSESCHTIDELEAYSAASEVVQAEMKTMADLMKPALSDDQVAVLVEYYSSK